MSRQLTILAVDDVELNRKMLDHFIRKLGHIPVLATNGQQALDYCVQHPLPDVILMDILMPVMDGFVATRQIRQQLQGRWVPIILLSAMNEPSDYLHGLEAGADDYLPKPVNFPLLAAKIGVMVRIAEMQSRLGDSLDKLEQFYANTQQEHNLARHVLERFNNAANIPKDNISSWLKSAAHLSGDVICSSLTPTGIEHVMLADSTGHGLVAALCCLPAMDSFHSLSQQGVHIGQIARIINNKLYNTLPTGHFVAAVLIAIDQQAQSITVWNGGIPYCGFISKDGELKKTFNSSHPPLGTMPPKQFEQTVESYHWELGGEVIACSDGITEARNEQGQQFGTQRLIQTAIAAKGEETANRIAQALLRHIADQPHADDASLVVVKTADY